MVPEVTHLTLAPYGKPTRVAESSRGGCALPAHPRSALGGLRRIHAGGSLLLSGLTRLGESHSISLSFKPVPQICTGGLFPSGKVTCGLGLGGCSTGCSGAQEGQPAVALVLPWGPTQPAYFEAFDALNLCISIIHVST